MSLTKASYSMINGAPLNVRDFGAVGDGTTDDTAAIQACFDTLYTTNTFDYTAIDNSRIYGTKIVFPKGRYKVTSQLVLGRTNQMLSWLVLDMDGSTIDGSTITGSTTYVLTIWFPQECIFNGLNVLSGTASAINIKNSQNTLYNRVAAGSGTGAFASLELEGMHFNNTWIGTNLNQNVGTGGCDWSLYAEFATVIPPGAFAGAPINTFVGFHTANSKNGIYWSGGSQITFVGIEMEGHDTSGATFNTVDTVSWSEAYTEGFPINSNVLSFFECSNVKIQNHKNASYYHYVGFEDCRNIDVINYEGGGGFKVVGSLNENFIFNNIKVLASVSYQWIQYAAGAEVQKLQASNITIFNVAGTSVIGEIPLVSSGTFRSDQNWLPNPQGIDALGNVSTVNFTSIASGSYTAVSPLGYKEALFEIDNAALARLRLTMDTTNNIGATTIPAVLVICFKTANLPAGITAVTDMGPNGQNTSLYDGIFYSMTYVKNGDWLISYSLINIDPTNTYQEIVWNYNNVYAVGTKFLFGGACLYTGSDFNIPLFN
jgi:hypothetical protein